MRPPIGLWRWPGKPRTGVVRELYEQLIAYWRAYVDRIPQYTSRDDLLLRVTYAAGNAIFAICDAVSHGAAALRGPLVTAAAPPTNAPQTDDPADPQRFLRESNSMCADFTSVFSHFNEAAAAWHDTDEDIPASQWSPQQRALNDRPGHQPHLDGPQSGLG